MNIITSTITDEVLTLHTHGNIDTSNATNAEAEAMACLETPHSSLILDMEDTGYISSAGLRVVLKLRKSEKDFKIVNVSSEVYEVFDMTGFTEMMTVEKGYKTFDVSGCKVIGQGAKGIVYRYNEDTIVKAYKNPEDLADIIREREFAKKAFVLGVPTAISYDIVKIGNSYGSVFELLDCESLSKCMAEHPENYEQYAKIYTDLLRIIHSTEADALLPSAKALSDKWISGCKAGLDEETVAAITKLFDEIPETDAMVHCDYHSNNIMMQGDEAILIDMDTIARGNPIYELANIYTAYVGFGEIDPSQTVNFLGIPYEKSREFYDLFFNMYFEGKDSSYIYNAQKAIRLASLLRIYRKALKKGNDDPAKDEIRISKYREEIPSLVKEIKTMAL